MADHSLRQAIRRLAGPAAAESDRELLDRWVTRHDHPAFELLVWRYGALVLNTCARILSPADAEDAFQATFLVLARKANLAGRRGSLGGWLHRVAVRVAMTSRRQIARRPASLVNDTPQLREQEADVRSRELRAVLDEELDRLPDRLRRVFVLCHLQGMTVHAGAQLLDCKHGTVLSRLHRGRAQLLARCKVSPSLMSA
jgi:RNA polymerase sigma factor (sigma-70 family)